jgi:hypothetical protein
MRLGVRVARGIWVSIPFTIMGFMAGGLVVAILAFFFSFFLWPAFVVDFMKEENGKLFLKICAWGYLLVGLYGLFYEPIKRTTPNLPGFEYTIWYFISVLSLIVCVAYFVVGYDIIGEKQEKAKINNIVDTSFNNIQIMPFEEMWANYVMPLSGQTISNGTLTNRIVSVDGQGITRQTSTGRIGKIAIKDFKFAYSQLVQHGYVEREFINQHANRCSSGIVLVLSQVPFIEVKDKPRKALYVKTNI